MNLIEQLRDDSHFDFKSNYFETYGIESLSSNHEVDQVRNELCSYLNRNNVRVMSALCLIEKINYGYEVDKLSAEELEILEMIKPLYDISDNEWFIQLPITSSLRIIMNADTFGFFFKSNGRTNKDMFENNQIF